MRHFLLQVLPLFLISIHVGAQDINILWDKTYRLDQLPSSLKDIILLPNDKLAIAGEVQISSRNSDGLFMILDTDGHVITENKYGGLENDALQSIAVSEDGSFYLVGYSSNGRSNKGWLLRLDEQGMVLHSNNKLGGTKGGRLEEVIWLKNKRGRNRGVAVGYKKAARKGQIWMLSIDQNKILEDNISKDIAFRDVKGMELDENGNAWVFGSTRQSNSSRNGDVWVATLTEKAQLEKTIIIKDVGKQGDYWKEVHSSNRNYFGHLVLAGEAWANNRGERDPWVVELEHVKSATQVISNSFQTIAKDNYASSIFKSSRNENIWITIFSKDASFTSASFPNQLLKWDSKDIVVRDLKIKKGETFNITRLLRHQKKKFILAGTVQDERGNYSAIRIICFNFGTEIIAEQPTPDNSSGNKSLVDKGQIHFENIRLHDANNDGFISPGEIGNFLYLELRNDSETTIEDGKIFFELMNKNDGIRLGKAWDYIDYLPNGRSNSYSLPINGADNLKEGVLNLRLTASPIGLKAIETIVEVPCIDTPVKRAKSFIDLNEQTLSLDFTRKIPINKKELRIDGTLYTNKKTRIEDIRVRKGKLLLPYKKATGPKLAPPRSNETFKYIYDFSITITEFEEGENLIQIVAPEATSKPITVVYVAKRPNLYFIGVGPQGGLAYHNLKFPDNDARDIAAMFRSQKGNGFFNEVYTEVLDSMHTTTKTKIQAAFERLSKRSTITSNDYVMVFLSGHGIKVQDKFKFVPSDYDKDAEEATTIDFERHILDHLNQINCKKVLFVDACRSGSAKILPDINSAIFAPGIITFASCSANESSYEDVTLENGLFTEALLEAFSGSPVKLQGGEELLVPQGEHMYNQEEKGVYRNVVTVDELFKFLSVRVPDLIRKTSKPGTQTPEIPKKEIDGTLPLFVY